MKSKKKSDYLLLFDNNKSIKKSEMNSLKGGKVDILGIVDIPCNFINIGIIGICLPVYIGIQDQV